MTYWVRFWVVCAVVMAMAGMASAADSRGYVIEGTIVDEGGTPIAGATVWLIQQYQVRSTESDPEGRYIFSNVEPAAIELIAHHDDYSIGGVTAYAMGPDEVDIELREPDMLELRIINESYEPIEGARLTTLGVGDQFQVSMNELADGGFPVERSDADGVLAIPYLPQGSHVAFTVSHSNYAATYIPYLPVGGQRQSIQLYPGATIRGRVTSEMDGEGVPGARVVVFQPREERPYVADEVVADPEGFYRAVVRPGNYYVTSEAPEYAMAWPVAVAAMPGQDENIADIELPPARYIEGKAVSENDEPFPGVRVQYWVEDALIQQAISQYDGHFRMKVAPSEGRIRLVPPHGYVPVERFDMMVEIDEVVVSSLGNIEIEPIPTIEGTVIDAEGNPQPNSLVTVLELEPPMWIVTDDDGGFGIRMFTFPEGGRVTLQAEHPVRLQRAEATVDLDNLDQVELELASYTPDTTPNDPGRSPNDLEHLAELPAPELGCREWFNSDPLTLEALEGKVVVLTLWSGFDTVGPGRDRMEELRALHYVLEGVDDVVFVGVHTGDVDTELAERYIEHFGIEFPVGFDDDEATTFQRYSIRVIPQTLLIDRRGFVRYYDVEGRLFELIKSLRRES